MAVFKSNYITTRNKRKKTSRVYVPKTKQTQRQIIVSKAKAHIRYIRNRRENGQKITRELFGRDGVLSKEEAYELIDSAEKGTRFFRFVISPAKWEDREKDLDLREITMQTMGALEKQLGEHIQFVAAIHNGKLRHVHMLAILKGRVEDAELTVARGTATQVTRAQRKELDEALGYNPHIQRGRTRTITQNQNRERGEGQHATGTTDPYKKQGGGGHAAKKSESVHTCLICGMQYCHHQREKDELELELEL